MYYAKTFYSEEEADKKDENYDYPNQQFGT